jgi:hypothetical protein
MRAEITELRRDLLAAEAMVREYRDLTDKILAELEGYRATKARHLRSA